MSIAPNHNFNQIEQMQMFCNGIQLKTKQLINTYVDGSTNFTISTCIKKTIEAINANEYLELQIDMILATKNIKLEDQVTPEDDRRLKAPNLRTAQLT